MGIIARQTINNTVLTYVGFALGALNTLFLYTRFMSEEYFGLVGVVLSTGALLMPLMSLGVPNTLVRYFSQYSESDELKGFLTLMLVLPLITVIPLGIFSYGADEAIRQFLSRQNAVVSDYLWHIFGIGLTLAYFEIFFAWSKVCLRSSFGTFMKEVFVRFGVTILLVLLQMKWISAQEFLHYLVGLYILRCLWMAFFALKLRPLQLSFQFPVGSRELLVYSSLILIGGSVSVLLLEVDRFMINQYISIENVAYYSVAIFIATVIIVPFRAMHQITYPLTASLLHRSDMEGLRQLYRRSSLTLLITSGLLYLLILLNLEALYQLLPESYRGGFQIVLLIGAAKVFDSFMGINASILYNSRYFRTLLLMGVALAVATILLNMWLIPLMGIGGAALATFMAIVGYNTVKLIFVYRKFRLLPWSQATVKVILLGFLTWCLFTALDFPFHPLLNIGLKSLLILLFYLGILWRLGLSEDLSGLLSRWLKKANPGKKDPPRGSNN